MTSKQTNSEQSDNRRQAERQLREAETRLGLAANELREAALPAFARAAGRLQERAYRLRHRIEDGYSS